MADPERTPPNAIPTRLLALTDQRSDSTLLNEEDGLKDDDSAKIVSRMWALMSLLYKPHPWHGISVGKNAPSVVTAFIEMTPNDRCKLEIDKRSGYIKVDRPSKYSSASPCLYGYVPQTLCGTRCANLCYENTGIEVEGDMDPLDICVISERGVGHGNVLMDCIPIGGLRMIDGGEADDKIIAVMKDDAVYGEWTDISDMPEALRLRIHHYFITYKQKPGELESRVSIAETYGRKKAHEVILASVHDYTEKYAHLRDLLTKTLFKAVLTSGATFSDED